MVCDGEREKRDEREMVEKKGVKEIQRACYEQWKNSRVHRTDSQYDRYSAYAKATNLKYLNHYIT